MNIMLNYNGGLNHEVLASSMVRLLLHDRVLICREPSNVIGRGVCGSPSRPSLSLLLEPHE